MKSDCPTLPKKSGHKGKKEFKPKKAYIALDDNEISSSSDDEANIALMASHHSSDEEHEVSDYEIDDKPSYDELQSAFNELYEEFLKLSKKYSNQNKLILSLESEANNMKIELDQVKNSACNKCQSLECNIIELNQVIKKYEKGQIGLENVLSNQRFSNDKCGLGFSNFDKPSTSHTTFVKATCNKFNNVEQKKVHIVNPSKRLNVRFNSYGRNYFNIRNKCYNKNYSNVRNNSYKKINSKISISHHNS
jgi:hypothetical protein